VIFGQKEKDCLRPVFFTSPLAVCLGRSVLASVRDWYYGFGQFEAWWLSFYDFMNDVLGVSNVALKGNSDFCLTSGWSLFFWQFALISEKPIAIHRVGNRLHKDEGLAVEYSDGFGVYALNGVIMNSEYVLTPAEKITPETVLAEKNVDQRRELIRKIGVERMLSKLPHRVLEKKGDYEMLSVNLGGGVTDARFLKMVNPSVKCFHIEAVIEGISTVEQALNYREEEWFKQNRPEVLT